MGNVYEKTKNLTSGYFIQSKQKEYSEKLNNNSNILVNELNDDNSKNNTKEEVQLQVKFKVLVEEEKELHNSINDTEFSFFIINRDAIIGNNPYYDKYIDFDSNYSNIEANLESQKIIKKSKSKIIYKEKEYSTYEFETSSLKSNYSFETNKYLDILIVNNHINNNDKNNQVSKQHIQIKFEEILFQENNSLYLELDSYLNNNSNNNNVLNKKVFLNIKISPCSNNCVKEIFQFQLKLGNQFKHLDQEKIIFIIKNSYKSNHNKGMVYRSEPLILNNNEFVACKKFTISLNELCGNDLNSPIYIQFINLEKNSFIGEIKTSIKILKINGCLIKVSDTNKNHNLLHNAKGEEVILLKPYSKTTNQLNLYDIIFNNEKLNLNGNKHFKLTAHYSIDFTSSNEEYLSPISLHHIEKRSVKILKQCYMKPKIKEKKKIVIDDFEDEFDIFDPDNFEQSLVRFDNDYEFILKLISKVIWHNNIGTFTGFGGIINSKLNSNFIDKKSSNHNTINENIVKYKKNSLYEDKECSIFSIPNVVNNIKSYNDNLNKDKLEIKNEEKNKLNEINNKTYDLNDIHQALNYYTIVLPYIKLHAPTLISNVIQHTLNKIKQQAKENYNYHILYILLDNPPNDITETIDSLVESSNYPLSIIFIGIGNCGFKSLEHLCHLDGDYGLFDSNNNKALRENYFFIRFDRLPISMDFLIDRFKNQSIDKSHFGNIVDKIIAQTKILKEKIFKQIEFYYELKSKLNV